ncbi:MAG: phage tail length tape measure family protein [Shewanella sp.]
MATAELDIKISSGDVPNATRQLQQLEKAGASAEKGMGSMRGATQNLSYQLQDIAVQAQMGTNGLTILAQQGPQIASVFGPAGAAVGALIGIGALIASVGSASGTTAMDIDDLIEKVDSLGVAQLKYQELLAREVAEQARLDNQRIQSATQLGYYQSQVDKGISLSESQNETYLKLRAQLESNNEAVDKHTRFLELMDDRQRGVTDSSRKMAESLGETLSALAAQTDMLGRSEAEQIAMNAAVRIGVEIGSDEYNQLLTSATAYSSKKAAIDAVTESQRKANSEAMAASRASAQQVKADERKREMMLQGAQSWLDRVNQLGATEVEQVGHWKDQELARLAEFEKAKAILPMEANTARIALEEEAGRRRIEIEEKVLKKSLEATRLRTSAEQQATAQMASMQWGLASQSLDAISMAAEEGSTMQKAAFVAGKGMAAAQAVMQAELASVSTMAAYAAAAAAAGAGGPALLAAGVSQAAAMKTMGYASAAVIAAQGFAGMFDNGGNIGSNQWGIVGENGPEIVQGPVNVTSRKKTAALAASAVGVADGGTVVNNYITQNIQGNGDQALAEVVDRATKNALNETQRDFSQNGRLRKTLGV